MAKLKVGIVGCGKIADCNHIPGYKSCKNVKITALCDIVPEKMKAVCDKHELGKPECYASFEEMLEKAELDAVSICTPNDCHYPMAAAALAKGLHVLCDKPMAFDTSQCSEMIAAAEKSGKVLHINHSWHYMGISNKMRRMIADGKIGEFRSASCVFNSVTPPHISWSPGADWFVQAAHEGSIVQDIAVHLGEILQWIPGDRIDSVAAMTDTFFPGIDVTDTFAAVLRYNSRAIATMELSWCAPFNYFYLEFKGSEGALYLRDWKLFYRRKDAKKERAVTVKDFKCNSQQNFVAAVCGKKEQITPGATGREAIAICNAITESGATGKFVKVKRF